MSDDARDRGRRHPDADSEARLDELRREAERRGQVDAPGVRAAGGPLPDPPDELPAPGPESGYWGQPIVKAPVWTWEVPLYFFVGGVSGSSAVIAAGAELVGAGIPGVAVAAHGLALLGALLSGVLLVSDLGRPARFLNMLRVFKWRSPMSVGAWVLAAFGGLAALAAWSHGSAGVLHLGASTLAGLTGAVLVTYTGVLLGATVIPAWASQRRSLPAHFAVGGLGAAAAILELAGHGGPGLHRIGVVAAALETGLLALGELRRRPWTRPLRRGASGWTLRAGKALSGPLSLGLRLLAPGAWGRSAAAACFVLGALLSRWGWVAAGRASAADPRHTLDWQRAVASGD